MRLLVKKKCRIWEYFSPASSSTATEENAGSTATVLFSSPLPRQHPRPQWGALIDDHKREAWLQKERFGLDVHDAECDLAYLTGCFTRTYRSCFQDLRSGGVGDISLHFFSRQSIGGLVLASFSLSIRLSFLVPCCFLVCYCL